MRRGGYSVGGEQSGHFIFLRHGTTGDGQLTAVKFLSALVSSGKTASELVGEIPRSPQVLKNVAVRPEIKKTLVGHPDMQQAIANAEAHLAWEGRILVRPSGTEALVRVMVEGKDITEIDKLAEELVRVVESIGGRG
jgi:phosphoglucosamine mutase